MTLNNQRNYLENSRKGGGALPSRKPAKTRKIDKYKTYKEEQK